MYFIIVYQLITYRLRSQHLQCKELSFHNFETFHMYNNKYQYYMYYNIIISSELKVYYFFKFIIYYDNIVNTDTNIAETLITVSVDINIYFRGYV